MNHHPKCECGFCLENSPLASLPGWDIAVRRFREQREIGRPPIDPDAEQLAVDVVDDLARAG